MQAELALLSAATLQAANLQAEALLDQALLATDALRAAPAQAHGQWQRLLDGLRRAAGRLVRARESEALLASLEQITALYEHSLQVLLG